MSLFYARAFPWVVQLKSSSEVGPGTAYPCKTAVKQTHTIFWETDVLRIDATILAVGPNQSVLALLSGFGEERPIDRPKQLILNPIGAQVSVSGSALQEGGGGSPYTGLAHFEFQAASAGDTTDLREQYLGISVTGSLETTISPSPGDLENIGFSSILTPGAVQVGSCSFLECDIPLYSAVEENVILVVVMSVTRSIMAFRPG